MFADWAYSKVRNDLSSPCDARSAPFYRLRIMDLQKCFGRTLGLGAARPQTLQTNISAYAALRRAADLRALGRLVADLRLTLLTLLTLRACLVFCFVARGCFALDFFFAVLAIAAASLYVQAVSFLPVRIDIT
jgi:hypothetical protein